MFNRELRLKRKKHKLQQKIRSIKALPDNHINRLKIAKLEDKVNRISSKWFSMAYDRLKD